MAVPRLVSLVVIPLCVAGCSSGPTTTWATEARSPSKRWLATARSEQWGGMGTAYDATTVSVSGNGSQPPQDVLTFSHEYATMRLTMKWIDDSHLLVQYAESGKPGDQVTLDFQVVRYAGITISAQRIGKVPDTTAAK